MVKRFLFSFFLLAVFSCLSGQVRETLYTTFPVEGISAITHSMPGDIKLSAWAGNQIMVEMTILIENGSQRLLEHFVENERYQLELANEGGVARIYMTNVLPEYIVASGRSMFESVQAVIYYPENLTNLRQEDLSSETPEIWHEQDSIR